MLTTILVFLNILLIEVILSIDNASVLAVLVNKNLTNDSERSKALKYGILGAYVFRGLSLAFVSYILYNPSIGAWFKILGGLYLCYLYYTHLTPEVDSVEEGEVGWLQRVCKFLGINNFWTTVIMVEFLDIVFSIDNLVACVSLSSNIYVVIFAVFLGIFAMRFVAKYFSTLLNKFPQLENSAFFVILLLGAKMFIAGVFDFFPTTSLHSILNSHITDVVFSAITLGVFAFPILKQTFKK
jgi:YkoY family integral membrane protein